jgi:hypothetical protein
MDDIINYQFKSGLKAQQSELTLKQNNQLLAYVSSLSASSLGKLLSGNLDDVTLGEVIAEFTSELPVNKLLHIILRNPDGKPFDSPDAFDDLTNSEMIKIYNDFFSLNPAVLSLLKSLKKTPGLKTMTSMLSNSENMNAQKSPATLNQPTNQQ